MGVGNEYDTFGVIRGTRILHGECAGGVPET